MRVEVTIDLGLVIDGVEHTAEFTWDMGNRPVPVRKDRIAFGEYTARVTRRQYKCADSGTLTDTPVELELWAAPTKATRRCRFTPQEVREVLAALPCVSDLHVTGTR
ncbi:hypothetical protein [Streptomyces longwoodensis]|uniref:hypothetical protein n=1 Tax=Streptomyces longwoodensis TaxID=68231 RepID=UPI0036E9E2E2